MTFTRDAWKAIEPIYDAIISHPFNRQLAAGTLKKEIFKYYLEQDSLYLVDFARALAMAASKAPNPDDIVLLLKFAEGAIVAERGLHQSYFNLYDIQPGEVQGPGCFSYTQFLLAANTHRSYETGIAALLPCFWIYREVGMHVHLNSKPGNPYQKWIDTYSGKEFADIVDQAIDLTDRVAAEAGDRQKPEMMEAFITSTRLEWMFWDCAYRMERWRP